MDGEGLIVIIFLIFILTHFLFFVHFPITTLGVSITEAILYRWQWLIEDLEMRLQYARSKDR